MEKRNTKLANVFIFRVLSKSCVILTCDTFINIVRNVYMLLVTYVGLRFFFFFLNTTHGGVMTTRRQRRVHTRTGEEENKHGSVPEKRDLFSFIGEERFSIKRMSEQCAN